MWKTKKFMVLSAVLATVLIVGAAAGIALAQDETGGKRGMLFARVAEILGIEQQKVEDAFMQATKELRAEGQERRLQGLVDGGKITQQEAAKFKAWLESRPDIPRVSLHKLDQLVEEGILTQAQLDEFTAWMDSKPDMPMIRPGKFEQLVEEGMITQEQADAYKTWLEAKPDIPLPKSRMYPKLPRTGCGDGCPGETE